MLQTMSYLESKPVNCVRVKHCNRFFRSRHLSVADPGFSRGGGREPSRGGVNTPNFPENCLHEIERIWTPRGGRASLTDLMSIFVALDR